MIYVKNCVKWKGVDIALEKSEAKKKLIAYANINLKKREDGDFSAYRIFPIAVVSFIVTITRSVAAFAALYWTELTRISEKVVQRATNLN